MRTDIEKINGFSTQDGEFFKDQKQAEYHARFLIFLDIAERYTEGFDPEDIEFFYAQLGDFFGVNLDTDSFNKM